jgi:O-antigen ligase
LVLDGHRAQLTLHLGRRRLFLLAVTVLALIGSPALAYAGIGTRISLNELLLVAVGALGLFVPSPWLAAALAPVWLFAPASAEAFTVARGATWALAIAVLLRVVSGALPVRRTIVWPALFGAALTISLFYPTVAGSTPIATGHDLLGILAGLVVAAAVMSAPPDLAVMARTIAVAGAAMAIATLAGGAFAEGRLIGAGMNANSLGGVLAMPCIAAVGLAWYARQPLWFLVAAPSAVALVQAQSRGALVAIAVGIGYLVLGHRPWGQRALIAAAAVLMAVVFGGPLMELLIGGRSSTELEANNVFREQALRLALQVAAEHPLRGIGYGMFPPYAAASPQVGIFINTHNEYARFACEAGIPAALLFVVLLVLALRGRRGYDEAVLRSVVVVYAATLLFGNFVSIMPVSVPFWLALGCLLARSGEPPAAPGHVLMQATPTPRRAAATAR